MALSNKKRLAEINQQAADLENSEFNTAKLTAENQDYYDQVFLNSAKAQRAAEMGMTDAETAAAKQTYAENRNLGMQNALNAGGGNISKYVNANLNANDNKFATSLAAQNDAVKRQNQQVAMQYLGMLGDASQNAQNVQNMNFQKQIMAEQAIGQAESDWYAQRDLRRKSYLDAGTNLLGTAAGIGIASGAFSSLGSKKTTTTPTAAPVETGGE